MKTYFKATLAALFITLPALAMDAEKKSILHILARQPHATQQLFSSIETTDINIDIQDAYGNTPLHEASYFGGLENVYVLIEFYASVNAKNHNGETPLDKARYTKQTDIENLLLEYGAISGLAQKQPTRPAIQTHPENKTQLHLEAAIPNHASMVLTILKTNGAQEARKCDMYGNTPLHEASYFGSIEAVKHLIAYGAEINALNKNGWTPLDKAKCTNQTAIMQLLAQHGGRYNYHQPAPQAQAQNTVPAQRVAPQKKCADCLFSHRELLHLPGLTGGKLQMPGIYHIYSNAPVATRMGWMCAFNAIDNMRVLENKICNKNITEDQFINACKRHAQNPRGGSCCAEQTNIAKAIGLPYMFNLQINDNNRPTEIVFDTPTTYEYYDDEDPNAAAIHAEQNRQDDCWNNLRRIFKQSNGPLCIHFCAGLMARTYANPNHAEGHGICISAIKNGKGEVAMYILDNINEQENEISQDAIRRHVEFIYQRLIA